MGEAVCPARDEECPKRIDHTVIIVTEIRNFAERPGNVRLPRIGSIA
jgi:hypothetical protein